MDAVVTRWWWIRHAPVTNYGGRIYGQSDVDADCSDTAVFAGLAAALPHDAVWVTSQLRRTRQTADAIGLACGAASKLPPALVVEPDLAEQHFGQWQGLTHAELAARGDGATHRFWLAPADAVPPGGESFQQLVERVVRAVNRLTARFAARDIVAVAHGGTIRAALAQALGLPAERALGFVVDNCSLTRLDHIAATPGDAGQWRVVGVNLRPLPPFSTATGG